MSFRSRNEQIFCKFKEIKELRGGILLYAAQAIPRIDAEIAEKGPFWTETIYGRVTAVARLLRIKVSGFSSASRLMKNLFLPVFSRTSFNPCSKSALSFL